VAFSDAGYTLGASYATKWTMLTYFAKRVRAVDLAGTAGVSAGKRDGLADFKKGWCNDTKPAYLCCRTLQPATYAQLADKRGVQTDYFPSYRWGEFSGRTIRCGLQWWYRPRVRR